MQLSPIVQGYCITLPPLPRITAFSMITVFAPTTTGAPSAVTTAPYSTAHPSSIVTSPLTTAVGATYADACTFGFFAPEETIMSIPAPFDSLQGRSAG